VARYRLRFVLQEFDLPQGITIIGRSLDCHLTIEDPLVSRRHARIAVNEDGAQIEDLESRNGVRVNSTSIREPTVLRNGDRVRIGTQDFVFTSVDGTVRAHARTTGQLRLCASCRLPYPRELLACPNCEATEQTDDDTLTSAGPGQANAWGVQLLVEALQRALKLGRVADAERIVRRATAQVEELVVAGGLVDAKALAALAYQATEMTLASNDPTWALWVVRVYGRTRTTPPADVIERLADVGARHRDLVHHALCALVGDLGATERDTSPEDMEALARIERLRSSLEAAPHAAGTPAARPWPGPS
jgi:hypothetical protein